MDLWKSSWKLSPEKRPPLPLERSRKMSESLLELLEQATDENKIQWRREVGTTRGTYSVEMLGVIITVYNGGVQVSEKSPSGVRIQICEYTEKTHPLFASIERYTKRKNETTIKTLKSSLREKLGKFPEKKPPTTSPISGKEFTD